MIQVTLTQKADLSYDVEIVDGAYRLSVTGTDATVVPYVAAKPTPPPPPVTVQPVTSLAAISQSLTASSSTVRVGDTFTVTGALNYSDGSSKPVTAYRLYNFDGKVIALVNPFGTSFKALSVGSTSIANDNSGITGHTTINVLPAS
jgi:hypothetical protein